MKSHAITLPIGRPRNLLPQVILLSTLLLLFLHFISFHNHRPLLQQYRFVNPPPPPPPPPPPSSPPPPPPPSPPPPSPPPPPPPRVSLIKECDIFKGEWIWDPRGPYYTNMTCPLIQEHQNCMKYGRPDLEFLKWRWKPESCELPRFDPARFLEIVKGKSLAFVGDSLARNQMQSLMCLLARVEQPKDISNTTDEDFKRMFYATYNFSISIFWAPFLIKAREADSDGRKHTGVWNLYLDEVDDSWASHIEEFDYVIISAGNWFTRPALLYENGQLIGCHYCLVNNLTDLTLYYSHRKAFRTALQTLNKLPSFKGVTFMRTVSPNHFENGAWDKGGNCVRTRPFRSDETRLEGTELKFYEAQVEEFREAEREGRRRGVEFRLLDATRAMLLRPDGHPSRYGHWAHENVTLYNDCVHWCLPGPIDTWNNFLFHML